MSLLAFFARVRGIADCNKMSENLNKARVDFRREMNALSEKLISNASARIVSVPRRFELRGSLIRHLPLQQTQLQPNPMLVFWSRVQRYDTKKSGENQIIGQNHFIKEPKTYCNNHALQSQSVTAEGAGLVVELQLASGDEVGIISQLDSASLTAGGHERCRSHQEHPHADPDVRGV